MKFNLADSKRPVSYGLAILIVLCTLMAATILSSAHSSTTSIAITNNSSRDIRHIYLSPVDQDNWGSDQLNNTPLHPGGSATINASCDQSQIKVIAEDTDGCFLYKTVSCSDSAAWTITSDDTPDCGS